MRYLYIGALMFFPFFMSGNGPDFLTKRRAKCMKPCDPLKQKGSCWMFSFAVPSITRVDVEVLCDCLWNVCCLLSMICCLFFLAGCGWSLLFIVVCYVLHAPTPWEETIYRFEAFVSSCCFEDILDIKKAHVKLSCNFNWTLCLLYRHPAVMVSIVFVVFFEVLRRVLHHVQVLDQCQGVSSHSKLQGQCHTKHNMRLM